MLSSYLLNGLKKINEITENINFEKTNQNYLEQQIKTLTNQYQNLNLETDEDFFQFLKKNEGKFKKIKVFIFNKPEPQSLEKVLESYFSNINQHLNQDKLFYFYFNLILIEIFLKDKGKKLPRKDLKLKLKEVIQNNCLQEKLALSKCLNDNQVDIIPMSDLSNNINTKCFSQRQNLEKCVINNFNKK